MTRITAFILVFFVLTGCASPDPNPIKVSVTEPPAIKRRQNIMVTIDGNQQLYMGTRKVDTTLLDSLLPREIRRFITISDTPTVVINADTAAMYGLVYRVMKMAKRNGAKAVVTVRD
jgi:biopolymer transport protein ExbD